MKGLKKLGDIMNTEYIDELLSLEVKKKIYDFIKSMDLEEEDKLRAEGKYYMHQSDELPHMGLVVDDDRIVLLINNRVYNMEKQEFEDNNIILKVPIPRDNIEMLLED